MPTTHTVAQGETLTRIARQYKYSSASALYDHPDNEAFRALRDDPNVIYPGDEITIPDITPKKTSARSGNTHIFCLKREIEVVKIKMQDRSGNPLTGCRVVMDVGSAKIDQIIDDSGMVEVPLVNGDESGGTLDIYTDPDSDTPAQSFELELAVLDPVETLSGVQARCNALGHDCGVADGIMGSKTRAGVKSFQAQYGLDVDAVPGPMTKAKLKEVYGC
ncbi:PGRP and LysM peptidoglycan-binding domain-containing protein [Marinagarivorans cellulosilyticus]|uniref:N-acetylmuramoyl-L-alanine amidase n=1 Tax=Marinagarivorans cellulosilyticus TaxID=2721545 RepID=A0AAN1WKX6_9GAMM|nr:peptidoglycan-binding protein [Marinagarivorans cellulosilyticus]BCD99506.1 N-acetylmuramoyl-L-alanine amidase [Marinagarivorans cellulosilyticus]